MCERASNILGWDLRPWELEQWPEREIDELIWYTNLVIDERKREQQARENKLKQGR